MEESNDENRLYIIESAGPEGILQEAIAIINRLKNVFLNTRDEDMNYCVVSTFVILRL